MKPEDYRQFVYEVMKAVAPGWERQQSRIEQTVSPVRTWMISELAPRVGDTVLELAAGGGETGFEAAALVGDRAGFTTVRTEELPTRMAFRDIDDYMQYATDTAGPVAIALRRLSENEREAITSQLAEAFVHFGAGGGYELPGAALTAVAS